MELIPDVRRSIPHFPGLDGIRALAIGAVVAYHADLAWAPGGFLGVEVFFVLSGYLITSLLWSELSTTGRIDLGEFYRRRARRLLPALGALMIVVMTAFAIGWSSEIGRIRGDALAAMGYVSNWYQVATNNGYFSTLARPSPFRHLWSLAIEEQFYLVWPVIVAFVLGRRGARRLALTASALALVSGALMWAATNGTDPTRGYLGTDTRAFGLLAGSALAFWYRPHEREVAPTQIRWRVGLILEAASVGALAFILWSVLRADDSTIATFRPGIQLVSLASVVLIAATVHPLVRTTRWLGARWLRWLGTRSYSIYLWHWPVFALTRPGVDLDLGVGAALAVRLAITLPLAEASYRFIEQPIRSGALGRARARIARRVSGTLGNRARSLAPVAGVSTVALTLILALAVVALAAPAPAPTDVELSLRAEGAPSRSVESEGPVGAPDADVPDGSPREPAIVTRVIVPRVPSLPPVSARVIAVGDSVMLGARTAVKQQIRGVWMNAAIGRQAADGIDALKQLRDSHRLRPTVIVHLGDNGRFTTDQIERMMVILRSVKRVIVVTVKVPRRWEGAVNTALRNAAARHDNLVVVDWHLRWRGCSGGGVFTSDGYHLTPSGARCYADLIAAAL